MRGQTVRGLAMLITGSVLIAACTGGGAPSDSAPAPTGASTAQPATDEPTAEPTADEEMSFAIASTGVGFSDAPLFAAIEDLESQGYTIEKPDVADPNLMIAGTAEGQFQFSSGDTAALLRAITQGAALKIIGERVGDEWTLGTVADITSCEELEGRTVAYHAVGSFNEVIVRAYIAENCPGTMPEEVIIEGSENRAAAMLAGQLDASPLELSDAVNIIDKGGDRFRILTSFNETLPDLRPATLAANAAFIEANPNTTKALIRSMLEQNRRISEDPGYLKEIAIKYIPSIDEAILDEVVAQYADFNLFDPNGGVTESNIEYTIEFFAEAGSIPAGLTVEEAADLSYQNDVLEEIGRQ